MTISVRGIAAFTLVLAVCGTVSAFGRGGAVGARGGAAVGPRGGYAAGGARGGYERGPVGAAAGGTRGGSYTTPGGTTIQHREAGGVATGPYGGVHAGGVDATRVTGPGGRSVTDVDRGHVGVGPAGGVRVGGSEAVGVRGYYGGAAVGRTGGAAIGPRGVGVAAGHYTGYVSNTALATRGVAVRTGFHYNCFTPAWFAGRPGVWAPARWVVPSLWLAPVWGTFAAFGGYVGPPANYDYGSTVVIQDNNVYIGGESAGTAEQYATQAVNLADTGRQAQPAADDEWQPLGVFGMVQGDETVANNIFELAVNKAGVIRGNYYDAVSDSTLPVYGSVDKTTQRAAWSIGDKKETVFEAGIGNLTQEQCTMLVHYGKDRSQQMTLVRLQEPKK